MSSRPLPTTPYKGLTPYSEEDEPFFFGREPEREVIAANLRASRLTIVYGPSGVGKTSLLQAGVAHDLRCRAEENLVVMGTPEFVVVVFSSWHDNALAALVASLNEAVARITPRPMRSRQTVKRQTSRGLANVINTLSRNLAQHGENGSPWVRGRLLVILDQFEEYLTYTERYGDDGFAEQFACAVNQPDLNANFLISIREDALAKLDRFKGHIPNLFENYLRVERLDKQQARSAITQPIDEYRKRLGDDAGGLNIEPQLVDEVVNQVLAGQIAPEPDEESPSPVSNRIEAPYLQLVMTRVWNEEASSGSRTLRLATLERLGGAKRIVHAHLDEAMNALPSEERDIAAKVFHYLITRFGVKYAFTADELADFAEVPVASVTPVLERLSYGDVRILRPISPPPGRLPAATRYEIFHDVLATPVLDWRLRHLQARRDEAGVPENLREAVESKVLAWLLRLDRPASAAYIAKRTGLAYELVRDAVTFLRREGFVQQEGPSNDGSPTDSALYVNADLYGAIGIKILPDRLLGVITNFRAERLVVEQRDLLEKTPASVIAAVASFVKELRNRSHERSGLPERLVGLGVDLGGHVDGRWGRVIRSPNLNWDEPVDLANRLHDETGLVTVVENDVNTLAIHEHTFGLGQEAAYFAVMLVSEGIGCGLIIENQLVHGVHGMAGEIGHVIVDPNGRECLRCKHHGCLETIASTRGILYELRDRGRKVEKLRHAVELADRGDRVAGKVFERAGDAIGVVVAGLLNVVNLERLVLAFPALMVTPHHRASGIIRETVIAALRRYTFSTAADDCEVLLRMLPYHYGARGAASALLQRFVARPRAWTPVRSASEDRIEMERMPIYDFEDLGIPIIGGRFEE